MTHHPYDQLSHDTLLKLVELKVYKISGKPFSNGDKVAKVTGVVKRPHRDGYAFTFDKSKLCGVGACLLVESYSFEKFENRFRVINNQQSITPLEEVVEEGENPSLEQDLLQQNESEDEFPLGDYF